MRISTTRVVLISCSLALLCIAAIAVYTRRHLVYSGKCGDVRIFVFDHGGGQVEARCGNLRTRAITIVNWEISDRENLVPLTVNVDCQSGKLVVTRGTDSKELSFLEKL